MRKFINVLTALHPLSVGSMLLGAFVSLLALVVLFALVALAIPILAVWFWCGVASLTVRAAYRRLFPTTPASLFELQQSDDAPPLPAPEPEWRVGLDERGHGEFLPPLEADPAAETQEARRASS